MKIKDYEYVISMLVAENENLKWWKSYYDEKFNKDESIENAEEPVEEIIELKSEQ